MLSGVSRVISVLVPLIFVGVFIAAFSLGRGDAGPESLPDKAALLIAPVGRVGGGRAGLRPAGGAP